MIDLYTDPASRELSLATLKRMFLDNGSNRLFYKRLAANDNSKNQVYIGGSAEDTRPIPTGTWTKVLGRSKKGHPASERYILQASVNLHWLSTDGRVMPATKTKMILYPQYNNGHGEFRLSGFLQGTLDRPSSLFAVEKRGREAGRIMFFGTNERRVVLSFIATGDSRIAREIVKEPLLERVGVFDEIALPRVARAIATREELLAALGAVNRLGFTESKILNSRTGLKACNGPQCIGQTLLAELNVPADGKAQPDYRGWEVKAYTVRTFASAASCRVTLMTPEPTGGYYGERGVAAFLAKYGTPSAGDPKKMYFEGQHRYGVRNAKRRTLLLVRGYDTAKRAIGDASGGIQLLDFEGNVAAEWSFARLIEHWRNKHARAVFVPALSRRGQPQAYAYAGQVHLATGNPFVKFMEALVAGLVLYDPGIRTGKGRSQFRITVPKCLDRIYENVELRANVI